MAFRNAARHSGAIPPGGPCFFVGFLFFPSITRRGERKIWILGRGNGEGTTEEEEEEVLALRL